MSLRRAYNSVMQRIGLSAPATIPVMSPVAVQYPALAPLRDIYNKLQNVTNKYTMYRTLMGIDPELDGAIDRLTKMVRNSYAGTFVHLGHTLSEHEKDLQKDINALEEQLDFKSIFYTVAEGLVRDGDSIAVTRFEENSGLIAFQFLPTENMTIVEREDQVGVPSAQVFQKNIYILNEGDTEGLEKRFPKDSVVHFSLSNRAQVIYDILERYTFGVWSKSPLEALKVDLLRKVANKMNDTLVRQRIVPREHHKLDLSAFDPKYFPGATLEDRYSAARTAAKKYLDDYKKDVATPMKDADKSYITGKDTEIVFIEPEKVTYIDPIPAFDQINQSIWAAIGPLETAVTGRGRRTYATELVVASYAELNAEALADIIKIELLKIIKRHLRTKFGTKYTEEDLTKIDIKIELSLAILRSENARQFAIMSSVPVFTEDELRAVLGYEPLTDEQRAQIVDRQTGGQGRTGDFAQTPQDIARDKAKQVEPGASEPVTPQSRAQRQVT